MSTEASTYQMKYGGNGIFHRGAFSSLL